MTVKKYGEKSTRLARLMVHRKGHDSQFTVDNEEVKAAVKMHSDELGLEFSVPVLDSDICEPQRWVTHVGATRSMHVLVYRDGTIWITNEPNEEIALTEGSYIVEPREGEDLRYRLADLYSKVYEHSKFLCNKEGVAYNAKLYNESLSKLLIEASDSGLVEKEDSAAGFPERGDHVRPTLDDVLPLIPTGLAMLWATRRIRERKQLFQEHGFCPEIPALSRLEVLNMANQRVFVAAERPSRATLSSLNVLSDIYLNGRHLFVYEPPGCHEDVQRAIQEALTPVLASFGEAVGKDVSDSLLTDIRVSMQTAALANAVLDAIGAITTTESKCVGYVPYERAAEIMASIAGMRGAYSGKHYEVADETLGLVRFYVDDQGGNLMVECRELGMKAWTLAKNEALESIYVSPAQLPFAADAWLGWLKEKRANA